MSEKLGEITAEITRAYNLLLHRVNIGDSSTSEAIALHNWRDQLARALKAEFFQSHKIYRELPDGSDCLRCVGLIYRSGQYDLRHNHTNADWQREAEAMLRGDRENDR